MRGARVPLRPLEAAVSILALWLGVFALVATPATLGQPVTPATTHALGQPFVNVRSFSGEGELAVVSQGKLWVLDGANGSVAELPVPTGQVPSSPSFSSDGRWVSFITTRQTATGMTKTVWAARSDGLGPRPLATFTGPSTLVIGWGPGYDVLAYITAANHGIYAPPSEAWLWAPGTGARVVARAPEVTGGAWSPDGTSLAVMSDTDIPRTVSHWDATITTYGLSGGAGRVWLKLSVTASAAKPSAPFSWKRQPQASRPRTLPTR
jgi:WD40 repeat protein